MSTTPALTVVTPAYNDAPFLTACVESVVRAADLYQRRNPGATSESTGGGVSTTYAGGIPQRVADLLVPFRMARAL